MECCGCQGAVTGAVISSLFSLWLAIGTFIVRPHRETLPTSVEHCNISSDLVLNDTVTGIWTTLASTSFSWNETGMEMFTVDDSLMSSTLHYDDMPSSTASALYTQQL